MVKPRTHDRIILEALPLCGSAVPIATSGIVIKVLNGLPKRIKVAWDCGAGSVLFVGLDVFTVKSMVLRCPYCGTAEPMHLAVDVFDGTVSCDCGCEFDPKDHQR